MEKEKILEVKDLKVSFQTFQGSVQAVRGVSWHLNKKETIAIVGESGCGKTVTIQTVIGLNPKKNGSIKGGEVLFNKENLLELTPKQMRKLQGNQLSIIFQDPFTFLNPTMTVGEQIMEPYMQHYKVSREEARKKAVEILKMISLPSPEENMKRYPHQLSGGMRQRIMIAMSLICNPKVLFADEPTTALDVTIQAQIIELMNDLKDKIDTSIVLITHDMGVVANMADRIYVMYAGQIVEHGDCDTIFHHPKHPYTWGLLSSVPRLDKRVSEDLYSIPGTPPDLLAPPVGCAFAARCKYAMNICRTSQPPCIDIWRYNKKEKKEYTKNVQMIFQDPYACLDPLSVVSDIVAEGMKIHKMYKGPELEERVLELLKMVGLNKDHANRFPHEFSGGQRQRIGIARALSLEPKLIVCDEPISALDVSIQAQVVNLLKRLQQQMGLSYLFITHDLSMVRQISNRIAVMYLGSLVEIADSEDIYIKNRHPYTKALLSAIPIADPTIERERKRILLQGDVPSPVNLPQGCNFCNRCPYATQLCKERKPQLREIEPGHFTACHRAEEM